MLITRLINYVVIKMKLDSLYGLFEDMFIQEGQLSAPKKMTFSFRMCNKMIICC